MSEPSPLSRTASRLYLVCGLAEVWTCAALRHASEGEGGNDIVVVYGLPVSVPDELRRDTLDMARAFYPWSVIVDAVDLTPALASPDPVLVAGAMAQLRARIGLTHVDEIFTHTLFKPAEQSILQAYTAARIVLFDNGTSSHVDRIVYSGSPEFAKSMRVPEALLLRTRAAYFSLLGELPTPSYLSKVPCREICRDWLLKAARSAFAAAPHEFATQHSSPPVLVLGKAYYRTPHISYADERLVYTSLIANLRQRGEKSIVYKEHPRANQQPLLGPSDGVQRLKSRMPVEIWPLATQFTATYSIASTALLTMRKLFDIPAFAIGRQLPIVKKIAQIRLVHDAVPPPPFD